MKVFRCRAAFGGKEIVKRIKASDREEAIALCEREGLVPLEVAEERRGIKLPLFSDRGVSQSEIAFALLQLSLLLEAGIPLARALSIVAEQSENEQLAAAFSGIKSAVERGEPIGRAFAEAELFPEFLPQMLSSVQTAEHLELVFKIAATYMEKMEEIKSKVVSSLSYPLVVISMSFLSVLVAVEIVLPKLSSVLHSFGKSLPLITKLVVFGVNLSLWIPPAVILLFLLHRWKGKDYRKRFSSRLLKLPIFGKIILYLNLSRFASVMAMLLKASVPLNRAIKLAAGSITNDYLRERLERLASEVEKGKKLSTLLANLEEIPTLFTNMVATGEESGTLDITFEKLSQIYEKRTYRTIDFWVSMIEPLTIIAIAVIVGIIVVSIMLPLVEITSGQFLK